MGRKELPLLVPQLQVVAPAVLQQGLLQVVAPAVLSQLLLEQLHSTQTSKR
ncbi:MAG: hypothetical protein ACOYI4_03500 [Christensenellales bacterium]